MFKNTIKRLLKHDEDVKNEIQEAIQQELRLIFSENETCPSWMDYEKRYILRDIVKDIVNQSVYDLVNKKLSQEIILDNLVERLKKKQL